jgi:hypothetical protein
MPPLAVTQWQPANRVEQVMAEALRTGDYPRFANTLMSARLYVPHLIDPAEDAHQTLAALLPTSQPHLLAFTSAVLLTKVVGALARGYQEVSFGSLRQQWPDPRLPLALNLGSPIAVFLPLVAVPRLAAGERALVPAAAVVEQAASAALVEIRRACLRDLAGTTEGFATDGHPWSNPPANALEEALQAATQRGDGEAFLAHLLTATVVLPTTSSVPGTPQLSDERFPWRLTGGQTAPSVPLFSSAEQLAHVAGATAWVEVPFLEVVAHWPEGDRALCFNPGATTELILSEGELMALVTELVVGQDDQDLTAVGDVGA